MKFVGKSSFPILARFRTQLIVLILLVFVPVLILTIQSGAGERQSRKQNIREATTATARLAAVKQENFIKNAKQLLTTVSQFSFLNLSTDRSFAQTHFENLRKLYPKYLDIGIIEADGTLFCSTVITNDSPKLTDWSCFQRVRKTQRFAVGDFDTAGTTPDQEAVDFGIPVFDERGVFRRILFASLDMAELKKTAGEIDLPEGAELVLFDSSGSVLAQAPDPHSKAGTTNSNPKFPEFQEISESTEDVFEMTDSNGIEKLIAVEAISDGQKSSWWVSVAIPSEIVFAHAEAALRRDIIAIIIITIGALVAAYFYAERFFLRPLNALTADAHLLAEGKWTARSIPLNGNGELADLSRTFHEMAVTLQEQRCSLETANEQLEKRVQERTLQLEHAGKELEAFSYSVSHDLRAPVRHISGFVDLLRDEMSNSASPKANRFLNIIADSAKQMGQLIDELLVFSKLGRVEMQKTIVDGDDLVRSTIENLKPETSGRNIIWEIAPLPRLQADPAMLRQVFVNLISNAIKYTQPRDPACIRIGQQENENETIIFVRDNGVGFDMQFADKLFGVFQRLHRQDEFEGTGIGLANVRRVIQRHGGRTWAEAKVGEGATFYFSLPKSTA